MRQFTAIQRLGLYFLGTAIFIGLGSVKAGEVDPKVAVITPPEHINWVKGSASDTAVLAGDPSKPGIYVQLVRWHAHNMARPHFHPNDRYVYVVSGIWWLGTGSKYDLDSTVPVKAGSYVMQFGKQIHYDGAKDEDTVIEVVGEGPATSTAAENK
jgi:hypothetical protein